MKLPTVLRVWLATVISVSVPASLCLSANVHKQNLQFKAFNTNYKLGGKVVLIEFGTIGCPLSEKGLDEMIKLKNEKTIPDLDFVRVEASKDQKQIKEYYAGKKAPFPVHSDPQAALAKTMKATAYPSFLLLDKFGNIRYRGPFPGAKLAEWTKLLAAETRDPGSNAAMFGEGTLDVPALLSSTKLQKSDTDEVKALSELAGTKGLLLVFVDTKCPFAGSVIREMPKIAEMFKKEQIPAVLVNIDDEQKRVKDFYSKTNPGVPVYYDSKEDTRVNWQIKSVPIVILVNSQKQTVYNGPAVWDNVSRSLEKMLGISAGSVKPPSKGTEFG